MLATATITYDLADHIGTDFDHRRTKVDVYTNVPDQTIIDTDANKIRLGGAKGTLNPDGTGSVTVWIPGAGSNPASWQTYLRVDYMDVAARERKVRVFGPFTITASADLADLVDEQEIPPDFGGSAFLAEVEAIRDSQIDISGISTSDGVVEALVKNTGGAGPLTSAAVATKIAAMDGDAASAFRVQQDARHAATYVAYLAAAIGDQTARINAYLASGVPLGVKTKRLAGDFTTDSTVTVPAGVELDMTSATITHTVAEENAVVLNAGATLRGGTIISPAWWNGHNSAWSYAVVYIQGDNATMDGVTLQNVPRVGVGVHSVNNAIVTNCRIKGNYPSAQWTEVETVHFGICFEPGGADVDGNVVIGDNIIDSCVQGVFLGNNFGAGVGRGAAITGNAISNCWNHGVYGYGNNYAVTGNSFNRTQIPVALSGGFHVVSGNSMYTPTTTGTDERDYTGISMRDASGCTVSGNTLRGSAKTASAVIDVRALTGTLCNDNIVAGNVVHVEGGASVAIRVGAGASTCEGNIVQGNTVRSSGNTTSGVIALLATGGGGRANSVIDNTVFMEGPSHGIYVAEQRGARISGNNISLQYDAAAAITLGMIYLAATASDTQVHGNMLQTTGSWGTNVTIRAIYEIAGTVRNHYTSNTYLPDLTKLAAFVPLFLQAGGALVNEAAIGAPTITASPGSTWRRTDGGAGSTLYVKETAANSNVWRAV